MKLSIITINYNNCEGLAKTLDSVLGQLNEEIELVVIDGDSNDGSQDLIMKHSKKLGFWVSEKDHGIYDAQNKGVQKAKGNYCLFLNSGDILAEKDVLHKMLGEIGSADIVYGDIITIDEENKKQYLKSPEKPDIHHFMVSTLWHPCAFIKRSLFHEFGFYNINFKVTGDYEFFIRTILRHGVSTRHVPLAISIFDLKGISNSGIWAELQQNERKLGWQLNFSDVMINAFEKWTQLQRSGEYRIYKNVRNFFPLKSS